MDREINLLHLSFSSIKDSKGLGASTRSIVVLGSYLYCKDRYRQFVIITIPICCSATCYCELYCIGKTFAFSQFGHCCFGNLSFDLQGYRCARSRCNIEYRLAIGSTRVKGYCAPCDACRVGYILNTRSKGNFYLSCCFSSRHIKGNS